MATVVNKTANWMQNIALDGKQVGYYGYPSTTDVAVLKGPNHTIHKLLGSGAPGSDHNNAPNGSEYTDMTNFIKYLKTGSSTWTKQASNT